MVCIRRNLPYGYNCHKAVLGLGVEVTGVDAIAAYLHIQAQVCNELNSSWDCASDDSQTVIKHQDDHDDH